MLPGDHLSRILQAQLRSPVSGILSLAQLLLLEGGANPQLRNYAQSIYDRGQRMLTVMDNLTDLDRIERGEFVFQPEPLVLNTLVEQIQNEYERTLKLRGLGARVLIQGLPWGAAPLVTWWGRENLLWGILENTFRNAIEAAPSGSVVELKVELSGEFLILEMDNPGEVPSEVRERFFEPFVSSKPEGVGLGTYMVRTFAKALGGDASMTTGQGRTSIRVTLPHREGDWKV
jgi:signal transduction histidine kinase